MGIVKCVFLLLCLGAPRVFSNEVADAFINAKISPDTIKNPPRELLEVTYGDKPVYLGTKMSVLEVKEKPDFYFDGDPDKYYTLVMIDLDVPYPGAVTLPGQFLHWLIINIKGDDMSSGDTKAFYLSPTPPPLSKPHRYVFVVYQQCCTIDFDLTDEIKIVGGRPVFQIDKFVEKHNLGDPKYGNYFTCASTCF